MDPSVLLAASTLATLAAAAGYLQRIQSTETTAAWETAAARLRGRYLAPSGPWYRKGSRAIVAIVKGVEVRIGHRGNPMPTAEPFRSCTWAVAQAPCPPELRLLVGDTAPPHSLSIPVAGRDLFPDHPAFGQARRILATDEDLARRWLNRPLRAALLQRGGRRWILEGGTLTVECADMETTVEGVCELATTTALMARRGRALGRAWAKLAARLGGTSRNGDPWPHAARITLADGVEVSVVRAAKLGESATRVRTSRAATAQDTWTLRRNERHRPEDDAHARVDLGDALPGYSGWSRDPRRAARRFDAATATRIRALRPRDIDATREVLTIDLPGLVLEAARIESAVDLARELRTGASAAYR